MEGVNWEKLIGWCSNLFCFNSEKEEKLISLIGESTETKDIIEVDAQQQDEWTNSGYAEVTTNLKEKISDMRDSKLKKEPLYQRIPCEEFEDTDMNQSQQALIDLMARVTKELSQRKFDIEGTQIIMAGLESEWRDIITNIGDEWVHKLVEREKREMRAETDFSPKLSMIKDEGWEQETTKRRRACEEAERDLLNHSDKENEDQIHTFLQQTCPGREIIQPLMETKKEFIRAEAELVEQLKNLREVKRRLQNIQQTCTVRPNNVSKDHPDLHPNFPDLLPITPSSSSEDSINNLDDGFIQKDKKQGNLRGRHVTGFHHLYLYEF